MLPLYDIRYLKLVWSRRFPGQGYDGFLNVLQGSEPFRILLLSVLPQTVNYLVRVQGTVDTGVSLSHLDEVPFSLQVIQGLVDLRIGYSGELAELARGDPRVFQQGRKNLGRITRDPKAREPRDQRLLERTRVGEGLLRQYAFYLFLR